MAIALVNSNDAPYAASPTATLPATPIAGNLLVVETMQRSSAATASLSGYTLVFQRDVLTSDSTYRRALAVFAKIAGASESASVSPSWDNSASHSVTIAQYAAGTGREWDAITGAISASGDNGAVSDGTSVSTGTTASTANQLGVAVGGWKNSNGGAAGTWSVAISGYTEAVQADALVSAFATGVSQLWQEFSTTATRGGTISMGGSTSDTNTGLIGGIVVFGHSAAAGGSTITASQTEAGDTQSAAVTSPRNVTSSQTEVGDATAASLNVLAQVSAGQTEVGDATAAPVSVLVQVSASQAEAGDTQAAAMVGTQVATVTAGQAEAGDTQSAAVGVVVAATANQTEAGDTQLANVEVVVGVSANQTEDGDTQAAAILSTLVATITASQTEAGDTQAAAMTGLVQILANQTEGGDTQAASLAVLVQFTADQTEAGDTQAAAVIVGVITLELGRVFSASVPLRSYTAAMPQRNFKAAV